MIIAFIIITLFIRLCNKVDILLTCKALAWLHCFTKRGGIGTYNTVVSNHFHSVKILFSSARSRDFDGLISIELPVSMYTTKTPIDMCRFNVRSSTLKNLNFFCKRQISIKLFYLYQRLQCRDNYFFKIKFVFFLYLRLSASSKGKRYAFMYIFLISQIVGYQTPVFIQRFPWRLHITITYNLPHLRLWYADVVTVIA